MISPPLELSDVFVSYGDESVLQGVDLTLESGTVTGLLGLNGSGKTTLMSAGLGLVKADRGRASVFGTAAWDSPASVRKRIGFVPQQFDGFGWMKVDECLRFVARHYGSAWDGEMVASLKEGWRLRDRKIDLLSPGDQQKVAILLGIGHRPDLLVLDEPVASLDPAARRRFLRTLMDANASTGQTILLSSHIASDIERVCSRIAVLHDGRIICTAALDAIKERVRTVRLARPPFPPPERTLAQDRGRFWVWDPRECGLDPAVRIEPTTLEDLFVAMTS